MDALRQRVRRWTVAFMIGLVVSGATALPIPTALQAGAALFGEDWSAGGRLPAFAAEWMRTVHQGVRYADAHAPFLLYGTDWLAFGHFAIALAFVGALRDPVRNRWLYEFGMWACLLVPPWALVCGQVRGIPLWWRLIDASFGIVGFLPVWLCHRWTAELERAEKVRP